MERIAEFLFQRCFSWDSNRKRSSFYLMRTQSVAERKNDDVELAELNERFEATAIAEQELSSGLRRINLRRTPGGKKPQWRWN